MVHVALRQLADNDLIIPTSATSEELASYYPNVAKTFTYNGKTWGYPQAFSSKAVYYNKDLFTKAGYKEFPKTWDEFLDATAKIKNETKIGGYGMIAKAFDQTFHQYLNWYYSNGGKVTDKFGNIVFKSKSAYETMDFYKKLVNNSQSGPAAHDRDSLRNLFNAGKVASFISGPWERNRLNKEINWGVAAHSTRSKWQKWYIVNHRFIHRSSWHRQRKISRQIHKRKSPPLHNQFSVEKA